MLMYNDRSLRLILLAGPLPGAMAGMEYPQQKGEVRWSSPGRILKTASLNISFNGILAIEGSFKL